MSILHPLKTISVLGCGWFGFAFAKKMVALGYVVKGSTTTEDKLITVSEAGIEPYLINFTAEKILADSSFFDADVLLIAIPPKRNSAELTDYPQKIKAILASADHQSKNIIFISSTSVYGDGNEVVNETSNTNPDTESGNMVLQAEEIVKQSSNYTIIRFAGLFGPDRNPGRFFAGKTDVPNGLAPVNLIHQEDAVGLATKIIEKRAFGRTYNACAPTHPSRMEFYTAAAAASGLVEPIFISEKKDWKIIESENVPKFLDYQYQVDLQFKT
ncbi:SDR family oxidoreductase [Pedobacter sandarakinus]|uniref:SDR family oxidoreductase n=1 Tax=Pedobacter sandarakinus TaxID=353156 RepID=UPI002247651E|nr:SDR family oxidoreductase [Pedobacter sandarakinus]MCX2574685.1 SDR family oxidoreductase [Pedobacter sandarakinus]